jgi:hypothetical protein
VDGTGSGSCKMVGFVISGVETLGPGTMQFICQFFSNCTTCKISFDIFNLNHPILNRLRTTPHVLLINVYYPER